MPYTTAAGSGVGAQAYGAGKIIVASDLDGLRELVYSDEFLVIPNNSIQLAKALISAINFEKSHQILDDSKSWFKVSLKHLEIYKKTIKS